MRNQDLAALDAAKEQFIEEWEAGNGPTMERFVSLYPQLAGELSVFIVNFANLSAIERRESDFVLPDDDQIKGAFQRGLSAGFSRAGSLNERLTEIGATHEKFFEEMNVTQDFIAAFQRQPVVNVPVSFWHRAAIALDDTLSRVQAFLSPKRLAFRSSAAPQASPVEFSNLLSRVHAANGLSDSQFEHWLREVNRVE